MEPGPITREQLDRFGRTWNQGEHVLVTGPTGSGKTELARHIVQKRLDRNAFVVVFMAKLQPDETVVRAYKGWTRWTTWKKKPGPHENRIILWPKTEKLTPRVAREVQKDVFREAFEQIGKSGKWTVQIDEGLITASRDFLNLSADMGMAHSLGRSAHVTLITLAQRPSHLPLIVYSSASHAFIGRSREIDDLKRLKELGGRESAKELGEKIMNQSRHDFTWVPIAPDWPSESLNMQR